MAAGRRGRWNLVHW